MSQKELLNSTFREELKRSKQEYEFAEKEVIELFINQEAELLEKHIKELQDYERHLEETIPKNPKLTSQILEMKHRVQQEAKAQDFYKAHEHLQQVKRLTEEEKVAYREKRVQRIETLLFNKRNAQAKELKILQQRKEEALNQVKLKQRSETDVLSARFTNQKLNSTRDIIKSELFDSTHFDSSFDLFRSQASIKEERLSTQFSVSSKFLL